MRAAETTTQSLRLHLLNILIFTWCLEKLGWLHFDQSLNLRMNALCGYGWHIIKSVSYNCRTVWQLQGKADLCINVNIQMSINPVCAAAWHSESTSIQYRERFPLCRWITLLCNMWVCVSESAPPTSVRCGLGLKPHWLHAVQPHCVHVSKFGLSSPLPVKSAVLQTGHSLLLGMGAIWGTE